MKKVLHLLASAALATAAAYGSVYVLFRAVGAFTPGLGIAQ